MKFLLSCTVGLFLASGAVAFAQDRTPPEDAGFFRTHHRHWYQRHHGFLPVPPVRRRNYD